MSRVWRRAQTARRCGKAGRGMSKGASLSTRRSAAGRPQPRRAGAGRRRRLRASMRAAGPPAGVQDGGVVAATEVAPDGGQRLVGELARQVHARSGAARRAGRCGSGTRARRSESSKRSHTASWISRDRAVGGGGAGHQSVQHLGGERAVDGAAGQRVERDDADQRALERADVGGHAVGDDLEALGSASSIRRRHALAQDRQSVARSGRSTSATRPDSKRSVRRCSTCAMSRGRRSAASTSWLPGS